jgi:hypothetical protein
MAITFVESTWIEVIVHGQTGKLLVREPNALEGVRYFAHVNRLRDSVKDDPDALVAIIQAHITILSACVLGSEGFSPAFPSSGTDAEKVAWVNLIPWTNISEIATQVATVGYPKTSAE